MRKLRFLKFGVRWLACTLVLTTTLVCSLQNGASAMIVPAAAPATDPAAAVRAADLKTVQNTLESKVLRHRLKELGYSDQEIQSRLSRLSDRQVHQLASRIHSLNPGGDFAIGGILILVLLVLLIIYLVKRV